MHVGSVSSGSCGRVLLLSPEVCSLFGAWVWLSRCSQGSLERIFLQGAASFLGLHPKSFHGGSSSVWCCQCSGLFEGQLQGKLRAGSGRRGLSPQPCVPEMVTSPCNQLTAFRHFLLLLSCGFWCVFVHVLPFGEGDGGRGRSLQCLKGSG